MCNKTSGVCITKHKQESSYKFFHFIPFTNVAIYLHILHEQQKCVQYDPVTLCFSFFQLDIEIKRKNVLLETFLSEHTSNTEQAISKILLFEIYSSHCFIFEMFIPLLLSPIIYTKKLFHDLDANFMDLETSG